MNYNNNNNDHNKRHTELLSLNYLLVLYSHSAIKTRNQKKNSLRCGCHCLLKHAFNLNMI